MDTTGASDEGFQRLPDTQFTASVFGGSGDRKKEMLRKKYHVVRKKNHVVRKLFYVASISGYTYARQRGAYAYFYSVQIAWQTVGPCAAQPSNRAAVS